MGIGSVVDRWVEAVTHLFGTIAGGCHMRRNGFTNHRCIPHRSVRGGLGCPVGLNQRGIQMSRRWWWNYGERSCSRLANIAAPHGDNLVLSCGRGGREGTVGVEAATRSGKHRPSGTTTPGAAGRESLRLSCNDCGRHR